MAIDLPGDVAVDVRNPIVGNSFTWYDTEPAAAKKQIVIHATASQGDNEDGFTMADYHVNHNGWGGIGVHFVCTKDSYSGRPGQTPAGAHIQYTGDLLTMRAGVLNNNQGKIHIEISGLFTPGNGVPSEAQLRAVRALIDFLLAKNNIMPSLNYYNQVVYHNQVAVEGGATECPGWQHPQFGEWFGYLQGGAEPSWFRDQQPAPAPTPAPTPAPEPVPVVSTPDPQPVDNRPEWERSWTPVTDAPSKVVAVPGADVYDFEAGQVVKTLPGGEPVKQIAGFFTVNSTLYARTQWSVDNGKWNGIAVSELADLPTDPGQGGTSLPVNPGAPIDGIQPPEPTPQVLDDAFDLGPVSGGTPVPDVKLGAFFKSLWEGLLGLLLSPVRLLGLIAKLKGAKK